MIVKLQAEHHLDFVSLKGGCRGSSESTLVKMSICWKSHATAHLSFNFDQVYSILHALIWARILDSFAFHVFPP